MIRSVTYSGFEAGPRFLVLGAIHGNEICGVIAIKRIMEDIESGKIKIQRGQVTFVPIANSSAYAEGKRYIERNLNRYLIPMEKPDSYEARLGNILCPMLASCDVLLDIHSYTIGGAAFASVEGVDKGENEFAVTLGAEALIYGWQDAYKASGRTAENLNESIGTTAYARQHGAKAVLIECGQHKDPKSPEIAYQAIYKALGYLGLLEKRVPPAPMDSVRNVLIKRVIYRNDEDDTSPVWPNFAPVKAGTFLAKRKNGETITAPSDGYIVLHNPTCSIGAEWFYFGIEKPA